MCRTGGKFVPSSIHTTPDYYTDCARPDPGMGKNARRGLRADRSVSVTSVGWINTYTGRQVRGAEEVCRRRARRRIVVFRARTARFRLSCRPFPAFERGAEVAQVLLHVSAFWLCRCMCPVVILGFVRPRVRDCPRTAISIFTMMIARAAQDSPAPARPRAPKECVWGRSRESSTGKISRVLHEDMFHMTQHHHMLLKPTRDVREGKAWAGKAKTPLQFPAQHQ